MVTEYWEDTDSTSVRFEAGKSYDACGCPAPHWYYGVVYRYNECKQAYWVYAIQMAGVGASIDQISHETEMASWQEVRDCLEYLKALEMHYKRVYGE